MVDLKEPLKQFVKKEFSECIRLTLEKRYGNGLSALEESLQNQKPSEVFEISRGCPFENIGPEDLKVVTLSVKIFVNSFQVEFLKQAVDAVLKYFHDKPLDNIILSYSSQDSPETYLAHVESLWNTLEEYVLYKKVETIGISDLSEEVFIELYNKAKVKPSILQINLEDCCTVSESLENFTKNNEIQLLTHQDPNDILSQFSLEEMFKNKSVTFNWGARYQSHVKCRGVLVSKGYVLNMSYRI